MKEMLEIYKEAKDASWKIVKLAFTISLISNLSMAIIMFYYIHKSYDNTSTNVTMTQDGTDNIQELENGETND